jgi:NAD(P)-dependent dehydrogenase (short-subunit alcohol dehydrogenase family)
MRAGEIAGSYLGTVLITGANRGIGLELARQYAARGWRVIATARKPGEAAELQRLAEPGGSFTIETLDVSNHLQIDALARKYRDQPLHLLINNAGITGGEPSQTLGHMNYEVFRQVLEVNAIGPMKMAEAFLPQLVAAHGKIVTLSSAQASLGLVNDGQHYWYRASKVAVNMLMHSLAFNVKPKGVVVALVAPGPVATDMNRAGAETLQTPAVAVTRIIGVIDQVTLATTGRFWDRSGDELPW